MPQNYLDNLDLQYIKWERDEQAKINNNNNNCLDELLIHNATENNNK